VFEGARAFNEGVLQGTAIRARREAEQNRKSADRIGDVIGAALARKASDAQDLAAEVDRLQTEVMDLKLKLAIARAGEEGRLAQVKAFESAFPNAELLTDSGKRFSDGDMKTKSRIIYEAVFDKFAASCRIVRPADHRND
jgi:hypothetical protein